MARRILDGDRLGRPRHEADKTFICLETGLADGFRHQAFRGDQQQRAIRLAQVDRAHIGHHCRRDEVNHPDHVVMFTWRTLTQLMARHGWRATDSVTYVPTVRDRGERSRLEALAVRLVFGLERFLGRVGRPYSADGLIVSATRR